MNAKKGKPPEEVWRAIERDAEEDEIERLLALSSDELDAELRAAGFDPAAERALGFKQAAEAPAIIAAEEANREKRRAANARLEARRAARGKLGLDALRERIEAAKRDPRLPQEAAVLFRNRGTGAPTIEELESLLDELEDLIEQHSGEKE